MSEMKNASMLDVASRAGVSPATVSLVLAGKGRISAATRARVNEAVVALGYQVNRSARSLRTSKTGAIGLYLPEYAGTLEFYMTLAFGAVESADKQDFSVVLVAPHLSEKNVASLPVDGFILVDVDPEDRVARAIVEGSRPVVVGEAVPETLHQPTALIEYDHVAAIRMLLDHLWERGSRRIGMVFPDIALPWAVEVIEGYDRWARERGMERLREGAVAEQLSTGLAGIMHRLLDARIDGLIVVPDMMTPTAMRIAMDAGRRVGDDLLVASYFDGSFSAWTTPTITALDFNPRKFGRDLATRLSEALRGDKFARVHRIPASEVVLIVRDSTARGVTHHTGEE